MDYILGENTKSSSSGTLERVQPIQEPLADLLTDLLKFDNFTAPLDLERTVKLYVPAAVRLVCLPDPPTKNLSLSKAWDGENMMEKERTIMDLEEGPG
jgi:hypothetical protein